MRISDWSSDVCSSDLSITDHTGRVSRTGCGGGPTPAALMQDALGAAVVVAPVGAVEAVQAHRSAAARGMDEAALADIDADVAHAAAAAEEPQVRRGQALGGDARPLVGGQRPRGARQLEVEHVAVAGVDKAAQVHDTIEMEREVAVGGGEPARR